MERKNDVNQIIEHAEHHCKSNATRLTKKRKLVLSSLIHANNALSAYEIIDLCKAEFDEVIYNLVNFMTYIGEPSRADRERIGWYVILFFIVFTSFAYLLFREYQKDYH